MIHFPNFIPKSTAYLGFFGAICCALVSVCGCRTQTEKKIDETMLTVCAPFDTKHTFTFLGLEDGKNAIITDSMSHYFDKITNFDMAIQMHRTDIIDISRDSAMTLYSDYLQAHTLYFSAAERDLTLKSMRKVFAQAQAIQPSLLPNDTRFIKIDDKIYGKNTYFTRQNCIVVPQSALNDALDGDTTNFTAQLSHELFHLISRYKPRLARKLYQRIGFDTIQHLYIADSCLAERVLSNPDGADPYKIKLSDSTYGVMLNIVQNPVFDPSETLNDYLKWDMYQVRAQANGWEVLTDSLGESTLSNMWQMPFYKKTTTNTAYTLHPDEILADNFVLLLQMKKDPSKVLVEPAGKELLIDFERILKAHKE